jgi:hypothetical protein
MKTETIKFTENERGFMKIYNVEYKNKKDRVYFYCNDWGIGFEPYNGGWSETEFSEICKSLFDDAYYVRYNYNFGTEIA